MSGMGSSSQDISYFKVAFSQHLFCLESEVAAYLVQLIMNGDSCNWGLGICLLPLP